MIVLLLLGACKKPVPPPPLEDIVLPPPAIVLSGQVVDGVFVDDAFPLQVPLPEGWYATPGRADTPLRLRAIHDETGARVEILALPAGVAEPLSRAGCEWDFLDTGRYRSLAGADEVTVATCVPDQPGDAHVFAVLVPRAELTWSLEIAPRVDDLIAGKAAGEALLRGVRFERATPAFDGL